MVRLGGFSSIDLLLLIGSTSLKKDYFSSFSRRSSFLHKIILKGIVTTARTVERMSNQSIFVDIGQE